MASQLASHGRGGAGNMADATQSPRLQPSDLETPTLKTPVVTTGRGGTGNMAKNIDPHETRLRQDVEAIPRRLSSTAQHAGRGGAGNVFKRGLDQELPHNTSLDEAIHDEPPKNETVKGPALDMVNNSTKAKVWIFGKRG